MRVVISAEAYEAINQQRRGSSRGPMPNTEHLRDGSWAVDLGDDTLARLREHQFTGESLSETILRICQIGGRPLN